MLLTPVETAQKEISAYLPLIGHSLYKDIKIKGKRLSGLKICHLNATATGGGVVELLRSVVPLLNNVGVNTSWYTLSAPNTFFEITKKIHNLLQGQDISLSKKEQEIYLKHNRYFAQEMRQIDADIWVVHDPQPAATILYHNLHPIVWRCHLDTSSSGQKAWNFLSFVENYDKYIFSMKEYTNSRFKKDKTIVFAPAIDPLSPKNWPLGPFLADSLLASMEVDPKRPIVSQISRFDPWKDPLGVIETYHLAKKEVPVIQLIMTGEMADDDPEGDRVLKDIYKAAGDDPDIHIWPDRQRSDLKINAIQVASDVILQKSKREGFGLTITEAMWKEKVVVGGNCGGIKLQIQNGVNGFLVESPREAAKRIIWVLRNPEKAKSMGQKARESVRNNFLIPRLLNNYLDLFEELRPQVQIQKTVVQTRKAFPLTQIHHFPIGI